MVKTKNRFHLFLMLTLLCGVWPVVPVMSEGVSETKEPSASDDSDNDSKGGMPRMRKGEVDFGSMMMEFIRHLFEGDPPDIDEDLIRDDL